MFTLNDEGLNPHYKKPFFPFANQLFFEKPKKVEQSNVEKFLTREETAQLCRVKSLTTLWNWAKKGLLVPALQSGRKPLYRKSDVMNFLEGKEGSND